MFCGAAGTPLPYRLRTFPVAFVYRIAYKFWIMTPLRGAKCMAKLMKAASRGIPLAARTPKWLAPHLSTFAPAAASRSARGKRYSARRRFHVRYAHPDRNEPRRTRRSRRNRFCVFLCFLWPHCIELRRMPRPMTVWTGGNRAKARFVSAPFRQPYRDSIRFSAASAASCTARLGSVRPARIRGRSSGAPI